MVPLLALLHVGFMCIVAANLVYLRRGARRGVLPHYPHVSILVPARNEAGNLRRLLPSLLRQRYPSFEVVVYDDGSEDDTWSVLRSFDDERLKALRGEGPPPGWIGKVHALYQATRRATGARYLFLDADAALQGDEALKRLIERFEALPARSVMTGLCALRGGGRLLVSLVPNALLAGLPWPLVRPTSSAAFSALNGQCWMIEAGAYHRYEPHHHLPAEVLEDVKIGRFLKGRGMTPVLQDLRREVAVYMYRDFREAWEGFRKNAYLMLGGTPARFFCLYMFFLFTFVLAPLFSPWLLLSLYALKFATDRAAGFSLWITLATPLSFLLGSVIQFDSALAHWTRHVSWKGRRVLQP